ncbi:hypothetical protein PVAND_016560 [Polypedilum vanderplanki]|uniref:Uncharacterized protein n=1 Tax=Polypedilum vanderplanki TaxID=319348 RepID=A0A9J6BFF5_POLVA|nr:hypothetical protein PVAND_016560 [Polypedilum vanderplanki]
MITLTRKQPAINFKYFDFLNRETLVDVTVIADGHVMQAHKIVLAAASSYFEDIFGLIPDKHPAIVLSDVTQSQLTQLMEYIYCGRVDLHENEIQKFKKLMQTLKMDIAANNESSEAIPTTSSATNATDLLEEIKVKEETSEDQNIIDLNESEAESCSSEDCNDFELPMSLMAQEMSVQQPPTKVRKLFRPMRPEINFGVVKPRVKLFNVIKNEKAKKFMEINPKICPFCKKISKSNKHRNEHVKYCISNPDRIVSKCPHCSKSFCDPYYVKKHMKTIHGDDCGKVVMILPKEQSSTDFGSL